MLESRFHHIHWLGNGEKQNNSVGRYFDKEENRVVALKIFSDKPFESTIENLDNKLMAIQEITSLKSLDHKNIVKLLGYFELHDKYHLILESCDHSLRSEIDEAPSGLGTSASKKIIKNILSGLHFCHQAKCLHRDLTPENILMCKNGLAKIGDFDRSIFLIDGLGNISPTPGSFVYNSPEILAGDKEYGLPSDVWSLGIIFCELLTGKPPWNGKNSQSQLREIHNCVGPLLPRHASVAKLQAESCTVHNHAQLQQMFTTISAPCCSFIMKCLDVNPLCRFTCGELLQHQFIKGNYK
ncbi:unnamed protein product [Orchesella dallaii]|uniref:Protein kinase domain-containing protein n=1 Tax=Orchesella dallaii TaxID=48710 RepID=A0ABP1PND4_9HEXA